MNLHEEIAMLHQQVAHLQRQAANIDVLPSKGGSSGVDFWMIVRGEALSIYGTLQGVGWVDAIPTLPADYLTLNAGGPITPAYVLENEMDLVEGLCVGRNMVSGAIAFLLNYSASAGLSHIFGNVVFVSGTATVPITGSATTWSVPTIFGVI